MASSISGGGYGAQVNAQFARDLAKGDSAAATSARNNSGITAQNKKSATPTNKKAGGEEGGLSLSDAARQQIKSDSEHHAQYVADHADELAHHAGLQETEDSPEQAELQRKRGYDRDQEELAQLPPGAIQIPSLTGEVQVLTEDMAIRIDEMDDPDYTDAHLLDDIPESNLEAASATLDTQMSKGVSKVAEFKSNPKVDAVAEAMEVEPLTMLSEPMDIVGPGSDRLSGPMSLEFPPEMEQVAAEKAARELASGQNQEVFIAGGVPTAKSVQAAEDIPETVFDPDVPPHLNQAGYPQPPVKPGFFQRIKYLFSGDPRHLGQTAPPYPAHNYSYGMPPFAGPVMDPYSYMGMGNSLNSMMMMMSMFSPYSMPMSMYLNTMPMSWGTPPFNPYQQPMHYQPYAMPGPMSVPGQAWPASPGMQSPAMSAPGAPMATTAPSMRYDPTPTRPGSVVLLDTFQADRSQTIPGGEVARYATGNPVGDVARLEIARPAIDTSWLVVPQAQATPQQIRERMLNELADSRVRMLEGATQSLEGLRQEGLQHSAVNLPAGPSGSAEVWATYGGLRQAWEGENKGPNSGAQIALGNYCRAFGLDSSKVMHKDSKIAGPERAKLQQALVKLSQEAGDTPQVKESQQRFSQSVQALAESKVSVVVAAAESPGEETMAEDRGERPLEVPPNFQRGVFEAPGTVTVGASTFDEEAGEQVPLGRTEGVELLANCTLKDQDGTSSDAWGSQSAAPRVSRALAALHARHPDKSNAEVLSMLQSQATEACQGQVSLSEEKLQKLLA